MDDEEKKGTGDEDEEGVVPRTGEDLELSLVEKFEHLFTHIQSVLIMRTMNPDGNTQQELESEKQDSKMIQIEGATKKYAYEIVYNVVNKLKTIL